MTKKQWNGKKEGGNDKKERGNGLVAGKTRISG